jgi:nucleotide-binding universal stress UspA family protein
MMVTVWVVVIVVALAFALVAIIGVRPPGTRLLPGRDRGSGPGAARPKRILFPFVASGLSSSALEAALRLAGADGATLMPVFLARVPMNLPLQAPLPKQSGAALMLQEAIEQRAARHKVPIDARIERGRDNRHALRQAIASCSYDRIVIAAAVNGCPGFDGGDVAWLLENAPGEIIVLRAADTNHMVRVPAGPAPHDTARSHRPVLPAGRIPRRGKHVMPAV